MIQIINEPLLSKLPRLVNTDKKFDCTKIRLQEISNGNTLIFFDDFDQLTESNLTSVLLHYNLDPDKVGLVIDEVKIIKDPYIYKKAKHVINPSKIYIRPITTHHLSRMVEESIEDYIRTNSWNKFDNLIYSPFTFSEGSIHWLKTRLKNSTSPLPDKMKERLNNTKDRFTSNLKTYGKKAAIFGGVLSAGYLAADHMSTKYANKDYAASPQERSQLIATLRTLTGKFSAYESEYDRANDVRKGILRRVLDKIKAAIRNIKNKLLGRSDYDMNTRRY